MNDNIPTRLSLLLASADDRLAGPDSGDAR